MGGSIYSLLSNQPDAVFSQTVGSAPTYTPQVDTSAESGGERRIAVGSADIALFFIFVLFVAFVTVPIEEPRDSGTTSTFGDPASRCFSYPSPLALSLYRER